MIGKKIEVEDVDEVGNIMGVSIQQQVIMRFTNWRDHTQIYRERKRSKSFKFKVDLTRQRINLLDKARRETQRVDGIKFVFADINCQLNVRFMDDSVKAFNSEADLASIMTSCDERQVLISFFLYLKIITKKLSCNSPFKIKIVDCT